ncbi:MAG: DUF1127 domain-containing protein [Proteobacteria bacterium]|nr:DUF1127 domain-containing protein [Pseudomonadota bacterium]
MTAFTTNSASRLSLGRIAAAPFQAVWDFLVSVGETNARVHRIEALQRLSDAELARRGIRREDIIRHVFADRLFF